ncbi:S1 RNA-binding domain-containing protein [Streptomyces sp. ISL-36]|uniref:DUF6817 domain-containing protein n=1 Tax=Streptomyces sp. ISL-36 TaxID=2819182 RepID=UPI001BE86A02|nr:S1 RNA-binding domain-containing protein [Streptomyces sp. ISL-36]MBT2439743.1 S1 RNA-binding domain-containing protein [Streptomyces sp. ISL-36]
MGRETAFEAARELLLARGADTLEHPGGTLLAHLERVEARLADWGARDELRLAGLCHAFYGTDGFAESLLPLERRGLLAEAIGTEAEELVYFYAGCDRKISYPGLTDEDGLFRDRFTGETHPAARGRRKDFAELTAANELDVLRHNRELRTRYGGALLRLFTRWRSLLSEAAFTEARETLTLKGEEREAFLTGLERGDVVTGVVSHLASFHVTFVELGGVVGMMNIPEVSWGVYDFPGDVISEGQELPFEVLAVDLSRERIFLSLKSLEPDPLRAFARGGFGGVRTGRVTKRVPSGVFVLVADGVEAFVDHDDLDGRSPRPGDELTFEVTAVNVVTRRVRLALR